MFARSRISARFWRSSASSEPESQAPSASARTRAIAAPIDQADQVDQADQAGVSPADAAPAPLGSDCMPLAFAHPGSEVKVCKVIGPRATQQYVKSLGFVEDASVEVISFSPGGVIVRIMGSTFGVGSELARRIYIH